MGKPKTKENPSTKENKSFPFGTIVWAKLLNRVWWPGVVIDPITAPGELMEYSKNVKAIAVVKFERESKYQVVIHNRFIFLYGCDRKIEFINKGIVLYLNQKKGLPVPGNFDMEIFKEDIAEFERQIGGDIDIFKNVQIQKQSLKVMVNKLFITSNTPRKKNVARKSLPKLPETTKTLKKNTSKTPTQSKPKRVYKPRTITQSTVGPTFNKKAPVCYSCHSQVGCKFTASRYDILKRHMATHTNDDTDAVVTTKKSPTSSTSKKRKNLKTKSSEVKKQKLQEELLKDWDNDGEDEHEELNLSEVQSSSNGAQFSNEEVVQTSEVQSSSKVQSSSDEVLQTTSDVQLSSDGAQFSNEEVVQTSEVQSSSKVQSSSDEVLQTTSDVQLSSDVVQSSNEKVVQTMSEVIPTTSEGVPTSQVLLSENNDIPIISEDISRNSEVQETSTSSPNQVFDFNENDNNTPVVELRQSTSNCSSTVVDDLSKTSESRITLDLINNTIFDAAQSESLLVEKSTEDFIDKSREIHSNELAIEIDDQSKSTELLLEKTVNTLDQIKNFKNSLSCISSSLNNSDANILTKDNKGFIGVSELSECGSLNKTSSLYKDIHIETNGIGIPLVENMSNEKDDRVIVEENSDEKEEVSNDVELNQLNDTTFDKNMPIENSCPVDSTSNKMDDEDKIANKGECLIDGIPIPQWMQRDDWEFAQTALKKANFAYLEEKMYIPSLMDKPSTAAKSNLKLFPFQRKDMKSEFQDPFLRPGEVYGESFTIYIPIDKDNPSPNLEGLTPDVNPVTRACQAAMMENSFLRLNIIDECL